MQFHPAPPGVILLRLWLTSAATTTDCAESEGFGGSAVPKLANRSRWQWPKTKVAIDAQNHTLQIDMNASERELEEHLIQKVQGLKYEYRSDIRDRAALEKNFRQKFEALGNNLLMQSVIRHLAYDRIVYFHCRHDVQQRICSKLGMKMLPAAALDDDRKRD